MFQTNMVHSLLKGLDPIHQKSIILTKGQIFNGKILKLYPGQLASLQLGGITLTAKLEAALTAGNRYWFQVESSEGMPVLKVVENYTRGESGKSGQENEAIIKQIGLSQSKLTETVINFFARRALPFSPKHLIDGIQTLQTTGFANERGLVILEKLVTRNLPITPMTFMAVQNVVEDQSSFTQLIQQLQSSITSEPSKTPIFQTLLQGIDDLLKDGEVKIDIGDLQQALLHFLKGNSRNDQNNFQTARRFLIQQQIISEETSPAQLMDKILHFVKNAPVNQLKQIWPTLIKDEIVPQLEKGMINEVFSKLVETNHRSNTVMQQFVRALSENFNTIKPTPPFETVIAKLIEKVGFQYERNVSQFLQQSSENKENVLHEFKSILLAAKQHNLPIEINENVQKIINRITGYQLLSSNQDGPITNFIVAFPIKLNDTYTTDVTIQWEGKKQNNGQLDPDHCRVLFYVTLEKLNETIIDVQIQNKILSVHVYNEHERPKKIIDSLFPILRDGLLSINYQLLSVKWTRPETKENQIPIVNQAQQMYTAKPYQGVDIRI